MSLSGMAVQSGACQGRRGLAWQFWAMAVLGKAGKERLSSAVRCTSWLGPAEQGTVRQGRHGRASPSGTGLTPARRGKAGKVERGPSRRVIG